MLRSVDLDSLRLLDNASSTNRDIYLRPGVEGLDAADYRTNMYEKPGEHGAQVSSQLYGGRPISMSDIVKGATPALYEANRKLISAAMAIKRDSYGNPIAKTLAFTTLNGDSFFVKVFPYKPASIIEYVSFAEFMLQFTAPDPLIYGATQILSDPITRPTGGGFTLPVTLPITSSASTGGSATVFNAGNEASLPVLTLTGPLTNPYIYNEQSGKFTQLNYTLSATDVVVIDMAAKTITLNNTQSLLSAKTAGSTWWSIAPGVSTRISLNTASSSDTGNVIAGLYSAYSGV